MTENRKRGRRPSAKGKKAPQPPSAAAPSPGEAVPLREAGVFQRIEAFLASPLRRLWPVWWWKRQMERERVDHEERDSESFEATKLPTDEVVGLRCVWVMEVLLPSHVEHLAERLRSLTLGDLRHVPYDAVGSILKARVAGGNSWPVNLGYLRRRDGSARHESPVDLPKGVDTVGFTAVTAFAGVTVIVAQFHFDDETARLIEQPFRTRYTATAHRVNGVVSLPDGEHLRHDALGDCRDQLRRRCERWMHEHLPGVFAGSPSEAVPSCELLTFAKADPLEGQTPPSKTHAVTTLPGPSPKTDPATFRQDYLQVLGLRTAFDKWGCVEMPGLVVRFASDRDDLDRSEERLVVAARVADFEHVLHQDDERTPARVAAGTSGLSYTLAVFALARLVIFYEARVSQLRDRLGAVNLRRRGKALKQIQEIEREFSETARDLRPLLRGIATTPKWLWGESKTFVPLEDEQRYRGPLFSSVAENLVERSGRLMENEAEARADLQTIGGSIAASANLSAARINLGLQIIAILVAFFAALAAPSVLRTIREWSQSAPVADSAQRSNLRPAPKP